MGSSLTVLGSAAGGWREPDRTPRGGGDRLLEPGDLLPRVRGQRDEPARHAGRGERRRVDAVRELLPADRDGDRRTGARAGRVRGDERRAAAVAQVVEEDLALAPQLDRVGRVAVGLVALHRLDHRLAERLELVPADAARDRRDDVEALAAGGLDEAVQAEVVQPAAELERGEHDALPAQADVG